MRSRHRTLVAALTAALTLLVLPVTPTQATTLDPPPNDAFDAPTMVTGATGEVVASTVDATSEPGEPSHAGHGAGHSVWFFWTVPVGGTATVTITPDDGATGWVAAVYEGHSVDALQQRASAADAVAGLPSQLRFPVNANGRYRIALDALLPDGETGTYTVRYGVFAPPNDGFSAAQVLTGRSGAASTTTFAASRQAGEPVHAGGGPSVWFRWTAAADGMLKVAATSVVPDTTSLAVYRGNALSSLEVIGASPEGTVTVPVARGHVYRIAVAARPDTDAEPLEDDVALSYRLIEPANDDLATAQVVTGPSVELAVNTNGTSELGEPAHDGAPAVASRWYRWRPEQAGLASATVIDGAARVALYRGSEVDDLDALGATEPVRAGDELLVAVDRSSGAASARVQLSITAPANDVPSTASALAMQATAESSNVGASAVGEPGVPGGHGGAVWFRVQPSDARPLHIQTAGSSGDTVMAVYEEAASGAPVQVATDDDSGPGVTSLVSFTPKPRQGYLIGVDTKDEPSTSLLVTAGDPVVLVTGGIVHEDAGAATFTIEASPAPRGPLRLGYRAVAGTASSSADFEGRVGATVLDAGTPSTVVEVPVVDDALDEPGERFRLDVTSTGQALVVAPSATLIADDDAAPALVVEGATVSEDAGTMAVAVRLAAPSGRPLQATVTPTAPGSSAVPSRAEPTDFTAVPTVITFAPGSTAASLSVAVADDEIHELAEEVALVAALPSGAAYVGAGVIANDDAPPALTIADADVDEDSNGTANLGRLPVAMDRPSELEVTVRYQTVSGTAVGPFDFRRDNAVLVIPAGQLTSEINVLIRWDNLDEDDEDLFVRLSSPQNGSIDRGEARLVLLDDDAPPAASVADASASEGDTIDFVVTLPQPSGRSQPIRLSYRTVVGTAGEEDFVPSTGTVEIPAGQTTATIQVPLTLDDVQEGDEQFALLLGDPFQVTIGDGEAVGTIADDDKASSS